MPLPQRVSQPTRDTLVSQFASGYGNGACATALADATAVKQRMPRALVRAILRKVSDVGTPAAAAVEMSLLRDATPVPDGGTDAVAGTVQSTPFVRTYSQVNAGTDMLVVSQVVLGTPVNCTAVLSSSVVVGQPAITAAGALSTVSDTVVPFEPNLPPAATATFTITVTPTAAGAWSLPVSIANNDANENPYNWTMSGTAT